jgi:ABC-type Na+ efflux pump permease subunit
LTPAFLIIALKDLHVLLRDRMAIAWVLVFPLAFALFFGSVMKSGVETSIPPISLIVVSEPDSPAVASLAAGLERAGLIVTRTSAEAARTSVRRGEAVAFVRLPTEPARPIEFGIDPSRRMEAVLLRTLIGDAVEPATPVRAPARVAIDTVDVVRDRAGPRNGFEVAFPAMVLWGLLGSAATFAIAMVTERSSGTLLKLRAAPIARVAILGGKAVGCVTACLVDAVLLTLFGRVALGIRIEEPVKYATALAAAVVCFSGLTMVLSVLGKSDQSVASAGWATMVTMAMLGGAMVPLQAMPKWLLALSDYSPVKWGIVALEGATWRGFGWGELARPLIQMLAVGVAGFASGVVVLRSWREAS